MGGRTTTHTPVEGYPLCVVREHHARRDHELREIVGQYPNFLVPLEIDAGLLQEFDGFRCEHVFAATGELVKPTTPLCANTGPLPLPPPQHSQPTGGGGGVGWCSLSEKKKSR